MLTLGEPFVLLDDARVEGASPGLLYRSALAMIEVHQGRDVRAGLDQVRAAVNAGHYVAGLIRYEAGLALEDRLANRGRDRTAPLLWFGVFENCEKLQQDDVAALLPDPAGAVGLSLQPQITRADYEVQFDAVLEAIRAGDIYQANLTFPNQLRFVGDPLSLYADIRRRARAGYGGIVWTGADLILSFSPELFFALERDKLTARPMKGTAPRNADRAQDRLDAANLREDPKQRAENLMIVDLLRNDMSRVCEAESVKVPALFSVETYPTVHQMTSTITGVLLARNDAVDVLAALFPCGSITGAPKIRAMELIDEIEDASRGIYTGSIGRIDPDGSAAFNVAIRTLEIDGEQPAGRATIGLGSGLVADSQAKAEWAECLLKGSFVLNMTSGEGQRFDLIETMRFDPQEGIVALDRHLNRMRASARTLGFAFDRHHALNEIHVATFRQNAPCKVRLLASRFGAVAIELLPLPDTPSEMRVAVRALPVSADDVRLRHKTTNRAFYDRARKESGADEVIFVDTKGRVTEGSFTNVFVRGAGAFVTPPVSLGLLPGVLRGQLLDTGEAVEGDLTIDDLAQGFYVGNALRGLIFARLK